MPGVPYLDHFTSPNGNTYELHDPRLDSINNILFVCSTAANTPAGVTWTPQGSSTSITGTLVAGADEDPEAGTPDAKKYIFLVYDPNDEGDDIYDEYISVNKGNDTWVWELFGNTNIRVSGLIAAYTPAGTVSQPTFTGTPSTLSSHGVPTGTVSQPTFDGTPATIEASGTPQGSTPISTVSIPYDTYSVSGTTLAVAQTTVGLVTGVRFEGSPTTFAAPYIPAGTVSQPTFTGADLTSTVEYTPSGTVSQPIFTGTPATIEVH